ncbi:hypothetical protein [Dongshaea marina]|uniref:hypothetical protein n=1 Tax=Dongshaea marina TaxID=2047966 RepID=UPI00131EDEE7|nr:hypothetical protein [Dongshaea marina]
MNQRFSLFILLLLFFASRAGTVSLHKQDNYYRVFINIARGDHYQTGRGWRPPFIAA